MSSRSPDTIRNIAVCGHATSGKTSLVESLLHAAGSIPRKGSVQDGNTVCDSDAQEKERRHSIDLAVSHLESDGHLIHLIDTPGYRDFIGQVYCGLLAADCMLIVVSADEGVQPNTRKVWGIAEEAQRPCLLVVNRVDREHANFEQTMAQIQEQLSTKCVPLVTPDSSGPSFSKVESFLGGSSNSDAASALVESIVESDEALMERYLEGEQISAEELGGQLQKAVCARELFPVLATSAEKDIGVSELLSALVHYTPPSNHDFGRVTHDIGNPEESYPVASSVDDPLCAQVFRVISDPYVGKVSLLRLFSGSLATNGAFVNPHTGKTEKVGKIVRLQGKEHEAIEVASAGEVVAVPKVESLKTFDVITADKKLAIDPPRIPLPMFSLAVSPKSKADEKKFGENFVRLVEEDVTLKAERDRRTKELVFTGMSPLHLQIVWERLKSRYGVEVVTKPPKTPYLETITGKGDEHYRHKKQTGGAGEFAEVWLRVEPLERGKQFEFANEVFGGAISAPYVQSVEKGVRAVMEQGVIAGYPVVDIRVTVYDGKEHPVDSKDIAFQKAGREAFKLAVRDAKPVLLEPIVDLEVTFPGEHMGDIQGDLTRRRGRVQGIEALGNFQVLKAQVPLAEISDYASSLGSMSGGQGSYTMEMSHYEVVPGNLQEKVVAAAKAESTKHD